MLPVQKKNDFGAAGVRAYERIAAVWPVNFTHWRSRSKSVQNIHLDGRMQASF